MTRVDENVPPSFFSTHFPFLNSLWKRVRTLARCFYALFMDFYWEKPTSKQHVYDVARLNNRLKESDLVRDLERWKRLSLKVNELGRWVFNLGPIDKPMGCHPSGYPAVMQIGSYQRKNYILGVSYLSVILPRRQIFSFPKPLRTHLLQFSESNLELQFVVFKKPQGATNFNLIFHHLFFSKYPRLGRVEKKISVGLFDGKGVTGGTGRSVPWHKIQQEDLIVHTDGESYFHSPNNLRVQLEKKIGSFYLGASDTMKAFGVIGIVLDLDDEGVDNPALKVEQTIRESQSLQQFIDKSAPEIQKIFTFNSDY